MKVENLNDEALTLDAACRARGITPMPPKRPGLAVDSWRAIAMSALGRTPPDRAVGRGDLLQVAGEISGELHEVITHDDAEQKYRRFYGAPEACWGPFKEPEVRRVGRINLHPERANDGIYAVRNIDGEVLRIEHPDGSPVL